MKRTARIIVMLVLTAALMLSFAVVAYAHACLVEELGGTYLKFSYSDGTVMKGAKIIVKDAAGETLGTGKTDKEGIYNYQEYADSAAAIVVNDGEGHMLEYTVPDEIPPVTDSTPVPKEDAGDKPGETPAEEPGKTPEEKPAEIPAEEPAAAEDSASGGMDTGTIVAVIIVVVAALAIALLFAKRSKAKKK